MFEDTPNDNKKCGVDGSSSRLFELRAAYAQESKCRAECLLKENCFAMSGHFDGNNSWCIGCKKALDIPSSGAKAFNKEGKSVY